MTHQRWTDHPHARRPWMWALDLLFAGALLYLLFPVVGAQTEAPPLQYLNQPFPVDGPVQPGDPIPLHVERCNTNADPLYIQSARTLRNVETGRSYSLDSGFAVIESGCGSALVMTSVVPEQAGAGTFVLTAVVRVQGRFRTHDVVYHSAPFEVRP
jgi:hypothetical protein